MKRRCVSYSVQGLWLCIFVAGAWMGALFIGFDYIKFIYHLASAWGAQAGGTRRGHAARTRAHAACLAAVPWRFNRHARDTTS